MKERTCLLQIIIPEQSLSTSDNVLHLEIIIGISRSFSKKIYETFRTDRRKWKFLKTLKTIKIDNIYENYVVKCQGGSRTVCEVQFMSQVTYLSYTLKALWSYCDVCLSVIFFLLPPTVIFQCLRNVKIDGFYLCCI